MARGSRRETKGKIASTILVSVMRLASHVLQEKRLFLSEEPETPARPALDWPYEISLICFQNLRSSLIASEYIPVNRVAEAERRFGPLRGGEWPHLEHTGCTCPTAAALNRFFSPFERFLRLDCLSSRFSTLGYFRGYALAGISTFVLTARLGPSTMILPCHRVEAAGREW